MQVDIYDRGGTLLQTYDVTLDEVNPTPTDVEYEEEALRRAREDALVPEAEVEGLSAQLRRRGVKDTI